MSAPPARYDYDVFISYSRRDEGWVFDWLVPRLRRRKLKVHTDRDFEVGVPFSWAIDRAVQVSRRTVVVLTPAFLTSEWTEYERLLVQTRDPAFRKGVLIPLLLHPCELPPRFQILNYVDFTAPDAQEVSLRGLVDALRGKGVAPPADRRPSAEEHQARGRYLQQLLADQEYLDFRGLLQVGRPLRLRLEDLYVPPWAVPEEQQSSGTRDDRPPVPPEQPPPFLGSSLVWQLAQDPTLLDEPAQPEGVPGPRVRLAQALQDFPQVVLLGDPGTGKSALVRWLALTFARGRAWAKKILGLPESRFPLLVPIAAYGEALARERQLPFDTFLFERFASPAPVPADAARRALGRGECLLLLDGLDEVLDLGTRIQAARGIERFLRDCGPRTRVVVTSRPARYAAAGFGRPFAHFRLLPFDDDGLRSFAHNWARAYEGESSPIAPPDWEQRAEHWAAQFVAAVLGRPEFRRLATNPLLATILVLLYRQGSRLPSQRVELYRRCVEALAETWNMVRGLHPQPIELEFRGRRIDEAYTVSTLGPVAYWLLENRPTGLLHRTEFEEQLARQFALRGEPVTAELRSSARAFLELLRQHTGLLTEPGGDLFDLVHPTFKEYLAARHLAECRNPLERLGKHLLEAHWQEVVLLTAGILRGQQLEDFLRGILERDGEDDALHRPLLLVARCLADDVLDFWRGPQVLDDLFALWLNTPHAELQAAIISLLADGKGTRFTARFTERLAALLRDASAPLRYRVAVALGRIGDRGERVRAGLSAVAEDDKEPLNLRVAAAETLGQLGERDRAVELLRALAGGALVRAWERYDIALALELLGQRRAAVELLLGLLRDSDVHSGILGVAAQALEQLGEVRRAKRRLRGLTGDERLAESVRSAAHRALEQFEARC